MEDRVCVSLACPLRVVACPVQVCEAEFLCLGKLPAQRRQLSHRACVCGLYAAHTPICEAMVGREGLELLGVTCDCLLVDVVQPFPIRAQDLWSQCLDLQHGCNAMALIVALEAAKGHINSRIHGQEHLALLIVTMGAMIVTGSL